MSDHSFFASLLPSESAVNTGGMDSAKSTVVIGSLAVAAAFIMLQFRENKQKKQLATSLEIQKRDAANRSKSLQEQFHGDRDAYHKQHPKGSYKADRKLDVDKSEDLYMRGRIKNAFSGERPEFVRPEANKPWTPLNTSGGKHLYPWETQQSFERKFG